MPPAAFPPPLPYHVYATTHPHPYGNPYPPGYGSQPATNGLAIDSLVSSLVGIPAYLLCLPFVGSIIGVVLGIVALNQIGKRHRRGREKAIAGIAIGAVSLLASLILVTVYSSSLFPYRRDPGVPWSARLETMTPPYGKVDQAATSGLPTAPTSTRRNRTAVASLAASVLSLLGIGSIIGIGLGVYALNQIAVSGESGRGLAVAGILVGAVTLLLSMIVIVKGLGEW